MTDSVDAAVPEGFGARSGFRQAAVNATMSGGCSCGNPANGGLCSCRTSVMSSATGISPGPGSNASYEAATKKELDAILTIERYYHNYKLRKVINQLKKSDSWIFIWKLPREGGENLDIMDIDSEDDDETQDEEDQSEEMRDSSQLMNEELKSSRQAVSDDSRLPPELQFHNLQSKFQDPKFFSLICQFLEMLGSAKTAIKCHSKLLLMAFMLNHHRALVGAGVSVTSEKMDIDSTNSCEGEVSNTNENNSSTNELTSLENSVFPLSPEATPDPVSPAPATSVPVSPIPVPLPTSVSTSSNSSISALWGSDSSRRKIERAQCAKICNAKCSKSLLRQIARLGSAFVSLCETPTCWFRRMEFMVAYSQYAKTFLSWKSKDALYLIKTQVELFVDVFTTMNDMNQKIRDGQLSLETCQASLYRLKKTSEYHFLELSKLLGSSKQAKECVQKELSKNRFLKELSQRLDKKKLMFVEWESKMTVKNQVRMAFMQSMIEKCPCPPRANTREQVYDSKILNLWHGRYHKKLTVIKRILEDKFGDSNQKSWLPQLITYLKETIIEIIIQDPDQKEAFIRPLDTEFLAQQCALNNCDAREYLIYFVEFMKRYSNSLRYSKLCNILAILQQPKLDINLTLLLDIVSTLDDMRVDVTQVGLQSVISPLLNEDAKKNELVALVNDFNSHKSDISNLENWVQMARNDSRSLISSMVAITSSDSSQLPFSRLEKLTIYFVSLITNFPDSSQLDNLPETFTMLRLPILHMQMLIRDTVMTFAIVQFTVSVSKDDSYVSRLKSSIRSVLKEDWNLNRAEMATKICGIIDNERCALTSSERTLLHGLVSRLLMPISSVVLVGRKSGQLSSLAFPSSKDNALWAVPRLALDRIRRANEYRLLQPRENIPQSQRTLTHFEFEVKQISQYMASIWNLSLGTYKPVYETVINSKHLWKKHQHHTTSA